MATVYQNTPLFVPQIGDVAVFTKGIYKQYGHIGLCLMVVIQTNF